MHRAKARRQDRDAGDLARGLQAGVGEAADDRHVETARLPLDRPENLGHRGRRLVVALDAARPYRRRRHLDLGPGGNFAAQIGEPALDLGLTEVGALLGGRELIEDARHRRAPSTSAAASSIAAR